MAELDRKSIESPRPKIFASLAAQDAPSLLKTLAGNYAVPIHTGAPAL
jgi:hypothetical protein